MFFLLWNEKTYIVRRIAKNNILDIKNGIIAFNIIVDIDTSSSVLLDQRINRIKYKNAIKTNIVHNIIFIIILIIIKILSNIIILLFIYQ